MKTWQKRGAWCLVLLSAFMGLFGCEKKEAAATAPAAPSAPVPASTPEPPPPVTEEPPAPGGSEDRRDPGASPEIASETLVLFDARSSFVTLADPPPWAYVHAFAAPAEGGVLAGLQCRANPSYDPGPRKRPEKDYIGAAIVPEELWAELQTLIGTYELAAWNGDHHYTHGLPQDFGGAILADYASGERIDLSDNQSPVMNGEAGEALVSLFRRYLEEPLQTLEAEELDALLKSEELSGLSYEARYPFPEDFRDRPSPGE